MEPKENPQKTDREENPSIVIKNARIIDGTGSDPIDRGSIMISGSQLKLIDRQVSIPSNSKVVDASGLTAIPGLIDSHVHLWGLGTDRLVDELLMIPEGVRLLTAAGRLQNLLSGGYTTVKDCGGVNALSLKEAVGRGVISGPRILAAGYFISQTFGHGDFFHFLPIEMSDARRYAGHGDNLTCDGVAECMKAARYALRQGADFLKISTSGGVMSDHDKSEHVQFTPEEIRAIVQVASNANTFVTAHCQSTEGMRISIEEGVRTLEHVFYPNKEVMELALRSNTVFVSTLSVMKCYNDGGTEAGYPAWAIRKSMLAWENVIKNIKLLHDSGVTLAAGSDLLDSPLMKLGMNSMELELLVKYCGFTPMDALVSATRNGARACGLEAEIGTLEKGKSADLVLLKGDPLKDISILQNRSTIKLVLKEGFIVSNDGLTISH